MTGRPSEFDQEKAAALCAALMEGKSLRTICADENMPAARTVYMWLGSNPDFVQQYARAREDQADTLADEIIDIADDSSHDTIVKTNADGSTSEVANTEWINRSRLRVDARKWVAAKLKPKKYGERMAHDVSVNPISVNISLDSD